MNLKNIQSLDAYKHAVIDVGSNSVRLVIYQIDGNSFVPIHNEKVLAGLGRGINETGDLSKIGVELALNAIRRFKLLLDALKIRSYDAIATAAARDAENGAEFINIINNEIDLKLKLISGEEEGRLSALGVKYGAPYANGIMGDLGGSSLELVSLDGECDKRESWQLGPLAIGDMAISRDFSQNIAKTTNYINQIFNKSEVLKLKNIDEFHAVGGAWRNIAHLNMIMKDYSLQVLHNYEIAREEAIELCNFVMLQSKRSLEKVKGISQRRAETLPYAGLLLREIINATNCKKIIISSYGLREGLISERLKNQNSQNSIISSSFGLCRSKEDDIEFSNALNAWIAPITKNILAFKDLKRQNLILEAAALLSNIGLGLHPDHRAYLTYQMVLRAPYPAISHQERVFLARTISRRYGAKTEEIESYECNNMLAPELIALCDIYGCAMRLGANLTSNSAHILKQTELQINEDGLKLLIPEAINNLYSETVRKRFDQLNSIYRKSTGVTNRII